MTTAKRRAPGMTPEQRREMIVQVALPLVAEHGYAVSTQQVARAAGIGEATIFRVFSDKDSLLRACIAEAVRPDHLLRELASIPLEGSLEERLVEAAEALTAHFGRMGTVVGALHSTGMSFKRGDGERPVPENGREESFAVTAAAIAELLEPDRDRLRIPALTLARSFGFMVMSLSAGVSRAPDGEQVLDTRGMVDLFLHGALSDGAVADGSAAAGQSK
jgi:AcrR family transcriptional regulator